MSLSQRLPDGAIRSIKLSLTLVLLVCASVSQAILPESVRSVMAQRNFDERLISVSVYDVTANETILSHHPEVPRNPASVAKLVTTGVGLSEFGAAHQFKTEIRAHQTPINGVLDGDIIIKGYGDPMFEYEDVEQIVGALTALGISHIDGDVLVDDTYFDQRGENIDPIDENIYSTYNAAPSATMINDQAVDVMVKSENGQAQVTTAPPMAGIQIDNELRSNNASCRNSRYSYEPNIAPEQVEIRVWGTFSTRCYETRLSRLGVPPAWLVGQNFIAAWEAAGHTITGEVLQILDENYSLRAPILHTHYSEALADILPAINKQSNNPKARSLFLSIGSLYDAAPATPADARAYIGSWYEDELGVSINDQYIDNGSGLSRQTRIKAENLTQLLAYIAQQSFFSVFRESLPIMGVDGTLSHRMRGTPLDDNAWMKTGSLRGVKALAGYMITDKGNLLAVSILHDDPQVSVVSANPAHEALLSWLYQNF